MENQIESLQRQVRQLRIALMALAGCLAVGLLVSFKSGNQEIIRTKGLIVEDAAGKPFIMMGSPIPQEKGRKRHDAMSGLVFVDSTGTDRLFMGKDGKLQIGGKLEDRNSAGWSYIINDNTGDERGGFGFADDEDRIGLGLDYGGKDGGEAIYLYASNDIAYLLMNSNTNDRVRQRAVLWHDTKNDLTQIKLGDKITDERLVMRVAAQKAVISHQVKGTNKNILE
ncbi:hypothetical protein HYN48_10630 [Flavobacterium magnum]|uniref:Uncharacterized protein n=1 Tax=Flavobacterium magnum TaxID=2162713 RepID=A0A2S0RGZ7_9FLAO|nr:hypothetical protein [Flavobacterium magnum]AWA30508.1 hypothetical protein HYN48_10630 [Flavobacterium magnum]